MDFLQTVSSHTVVPAPAVKPAARDTRPDSRAGNDAFQSLLHQELSDKSEAAAPVALAGSETPSVTENAKSDEVTAEAVSEEAVPEEKVQEAEPEVQASEVPVEQPAAEPIQLQSNLSETVQVETVELLDSSIPTKEAVVEVSAEDQPQEDATQAVVTKAIEVLLDTDLLMASPELRSQMQDLAQKLLQMIPEGEQDSDYARGLEWMIEAMDMEGTELEEFVQFLHLDGAKEFLGRLQADLGSSLNSWHSRNTQSGLPSVNELLETLQAQDMEIITEPAKEAVVQDSAVTAKVDAVARILLKLDAQSPRPEAEKLSVDTMESGTESVSEDAVQSVTDTTGSNSGKQDAEGFLADDGNEELSGKALLKKMQERGFSKELITQVSDEVVVEDSGPEVVVRAISQKAVTQVMARNPQFVSSSRVVVTQVAEQIQKLAPPEVTRIKMVLKPENLGELRLELKQNKGTIQVTIETQSQSIKEVLERGMHQVKDSLRIPGGEQAEIKVIVREDGFSELMQQGRNHESQKRRQGRNQGSQKDQDREEAQFSEEISALSGQGSRVDLAV